MYGAAKLYVLYIFPSSSGRRGLDIPSLILMTFLQRWKKLMAMLPRHNFENLEDSHWKWSNAVFTLYRLVRTIWFWNPRYTYSKGKSSTNKNTYVRRRQRRWLSQCAEAQWGFFTVRSRGNHCVILAETPASMVGLIVESYSSVVSPLFGQQAEEL